MATTGEFSWDVSLHSFSFQLPYLFRNVFHVKPEVVECFGTISEDKRFHPIKVYMCCWCDSITFTLWQTNIAGWKMDPLNQDVSPIKKMGGFPLLLLMDKILHHQEWWLSHYS